jgi:hypothetical protein
MVVRPRSVPLLWTGWGPLYLLSFSLALLPYALPPIPWSVDYANHLARMAVLARGDADPFLSAVYEIRFGSPTNLAMDLAVPALSLLVGVEAATKAFFLAGILLCLTGVVALERAWSGRIGPAGLFAAVAVYSVPFAWGFVNFVFAMGLAIWGVALWVRMLDAAPWRRLAAHVATGLAIAFVHLFAFGLYGLTVGLVSLLAASADPARRTVGRLAGEVAILAAPLVAYLAASLLNGEPVGDRLVRMSLGHKVETGLDVFHAYTPFGRYLLLGWVAFLVALLASAAVRTDRALVLLGGFFLALFAAMPMAVLGTYHMPERVFAWAAFVLPAVFAWTRFAPWHAAVLVAAMLISTTLAALPAAAGAAFVAEVRATAAALPTGRRILVAQAPSADRFGMAFRRHVPVLAVPDASAFVPTFFTHPGKQPVRTRPAFHAIDVWEGIPPTLGELLHGVAVAGTFLPWTETRPGVRPYFADWRADFDYVWVIGTGDGIPDPPWLSPVRVGRDFTLYATGRTPGP